MRWSFELPGATVLMVATGMALSSIGCYLPMSTAAPQNPDTVRKGNFGVTFHGEYQAIDLLATPARAPDPAAPERYPSAELPTFHMDVAYGVSSRLDLELGVDGLLVVALPVPTGLSAGVRYQLVRSSSVDVSLASRFGVLYGSSKDKEGTSGHGQLHHVHAALALRLKQAKWRPGLALSVVPARAMTELSSGESRNVDALAASSTFSLTLGSGRMQLSPFVNVGILSTDNVRGTSAFFGVGLAACFRAN
ncbi:MAG: hypothetical protein HY698_14980 [Deltaproteobacteria bacterium]|nr:hypothetical protein [Deltaproteobacteria bacterium]